MSEKKTGPLADLHKLFDDVRMANIRRGSGEQDARRPTAKTKARREAIRKGVEAGAVRAAPAGRLLQGVPPLVPLARGSYTHEKPSAEAA